MKIMKFNSVAEIVEYYKSLDDFEDPIYYVLQATTPKTKEVLKNEVMAWPTEKLEGFSKMFNDYFKVSIPLPYLHEIVIDDLHLALEVEQGYLSDPLIRSLSFIAFMRKMEVHKSITEDAEVNMAYRKLSFPSAYLSESEEMKNNSIVLSFKQKMNEIGAKILI